MNTSLKHAFSCAGCKFYQDFYTWLHVILALITILSSYGRGHVRLSWHSPSISLKLFIQSFKQKLINKSYVAASHYQTQNRNIQVWPEVYWNEPERRGTNPQLHQNDPVSLCHSVSFRHILMSIIRFILVSFWFTLAHSEIFFSVPGFSSALVLCRGLSCSLLNIQT